MKLPSFNALRSLFARWRHRAAFAFALLLSVAGLRAQSDALTTFPDGGVNSDVAGPLVAAPDGNFYAATNYSGVNRTGAIVQCTPEGTTTLIYSFGADDASGFPSATGSSPSGGLLVGHDGALYGTTEAGGGATAQGVVYRVTTTGDYTVLATLGTSTGSGCVGPLVQDSAGNLYGANTYGGQYGNGAIFKVTAGGSISSIHDFSPILSTPTDPGYNADGATPLTGLVINATGTIFGTTSVGGTNNSGTVFEISSEGSLNNLYSFPPTGAPQSGNPSGSLAISSTGIIYGTTPSGGPNFNGTVFKFTGEEVTTLYTFSAPEPNSNDNSDGAIPTGVTVGQDGNLYGVTTYYGPDGSGTIYRVTPGGEFTTLYGFPSDQSATTAPILGADGDVYGNGTLAGSTYYSLESTLAPIITSGSARQASVNRVFTYQTVATNSPSSFAASGLPAGLAIDSTTGLIYGALGETGVFPVQLSAENADGTGFLTLTITAGGSAGNLPIIQVPAGPVSAHLNDPFFLEFDVSKLPKRWTAVGLPPGTEIDPRSGAIRGAAEKIGHYLTVLEAAYDKGKSANTFEVIVSAAPDLPKVKVMAPDPNPNAGADAKGVFRVTLSEPSGIDLVIPYAVQGSATPGVDYVPLTGSVTIKAGETMRKIYVVPLKSSDETGPKVVQLKLEDGTGYTVETHDFVGVKIDP